MDHVSFTEAVERLAGRIGYALHYEDGGAAPETTGRSRLYAANGAAAEFFRAPARRRPRPRRARRFLGERGFDAGAAAHFGVGYAPKGWSNLRDALHKQGFTDEELSSAGLVSQGQRGVYDRFRGRAIWPIRDVTGQVIGFGARKLYDDDQGPKYLNTPETPVYQQGSGALRARPRQARHLARSSGRRRRGLHRCDGLPPRRHHDRDRDAAAPRSAPTTSRCCDASWATTPPSGEVVFTFDPDAAGQKAALRAFADEKRFDAQTYVAVAPEGLDPCDLRLQRGDGAVRALMDTKVPMFEFVIDQRLAGFDLSTVEGRVGALRAAAPIVAEIRDPLAAPGYVRVLARRLGMDPRRCDARWSAPRAAQAARGRGPACTRRPRRAGDARRPSA